MPRSSRVLTMTGLQFSRRLAIVAGVVLPALETARRWREMSDLALLPFWLDDWIIAAFLLFGAWQTRSGQQGGRATLTAAWGFACGMAYSSFFSQLYELSRPDPSGIQTTTVVAIKGIMLTVATVALIATVKSRAEHS
jgi:hypothetical protein